MDIPKLKKSSRDREFVLYTPEQRAKIVWGYLFQGRSHRQLDEDVLKLDRARTEGWQSMGVLHYLGLVGAFKGIFKDHTLKDAIEELSRSQNDDYTQIIGILKSMVNDKSVCKEAKMIRWNCFPGYTMIPKHMQSIVDVFEKALPNIDSDRHTLESNSVLSIVEKSLSDLGYEVEKGKKKEELIHIPVLYGENRKAILSFDADAYHTQTKTVVEVEAGRAVSNYQFLKDFYEACMMQEVEHLCIAVRNHYRGSCDFEKVSSFFETLFSSNRMQVPLKSILIIGY